MLKKLNGKITKLLFYIKNNFLGSVFKLSVFAIMLILIYLVCILKQANSIKSNNYDDMQPFESSQKLMLTTPTEIPFSLDISPSTTEATLVIIGNSIPKTDNYIGTHPLFPIQEQTTSQIILDQTTKASFIQRTTEETRVIPSPESEISLKSPFSLDELKMLESTTESLKKKTTPKPDQIEEPEQEHEKEKQISILLQTTTSPPEKAIDIENTTTPIPATITDIAESDGLFMDNWSQYLPIHSDDSQILAPEQTSSQLNDFNEPTESFFLNEDDLVSTMEAPIMPMNKSDDADDSHKETTIPYLIEDIDHNHDISKDVNLNKEFVDDKMVSLNTPPVLSPNNLFDLFTLDHIPASSSMKGMWWPKSNNIPEPRAVASKTTGTPVQSQKRHTNAIYPIEESEERNQGAYIFNQLNKFQNLDTLLNGRFKDSVNFLEKFFSQFN